MPKETFFNLPEKKRETILQAALDEFTENIFPEASINQIIARAEIPKGSFYQYFEDKADIFNHISEIIQKEKLKYVSPALMNPQDHDFFKVLEAMYLSGIQFAVDHPKYTAFGNNFMAIKDSQLYTQMITEKEHAAIGYYQILLEQGISNGELRNDLDVSLLAFILWKMSMAMIEYHMQYVTNDFDDSVMTTAYKFFDFLKKGIEKQGGPNE